MIQYWNWVLFNCWPSIFRVQTKVSDSAIGQINVSTIYKYIANKAVNILENSLCFCFNIKCAWDTVYNKFVSQLKDCFVVDKMFFLKYDNSISETDISCY